MFAFLLASWWLLAAPSRLPAAPAGKQRPNLVFLMADDQCTFSLAAYGALHAKTTHLDRLARHGVVFDKHYATTAICMASRASVMTGMFEYRTGCNFDHGPLLASHWQRSYPLLLRAAGYQTAFAGKFGFEVADRVGGPRKLPQTDFDRWGGGPGQTSYQTRMNASIAEYADRYPHATLAYGAFGSDFIRHAAQSPHRPFCLSISFKAPHRPVVPDPRFDAVYRGVTFPKPPNFGRDYGLHFAPQSRQGRQYERFRSWGYEQTYEQVMARYYQQIYGIDVAVGMILQALREAGCAQNTVVIYTSDNGFLCGAHGYGSKVLPYEEASRVPLIIYDGRTAAPLRDEGKQGEPAPTTTRCAALTGNVDIAPTLLDLAGVPIPPNLDGKSLVPLLAAPQTDTPRVLPLINVWGPAKVHSLSVVTRDWKYVYWPYDQAGFQPYEELYATTDDPYELTNRRDDPQAGAALQRMRELYDAQVRHWKTMAVPYHDYQRYANVFRRR